jgi:hypothetical protein
MDARIDPATAFGISLGDAHVIRNVRLFPVTSSSFSPIAQKPHPLLTVPHIPRPEHPLPTLSAP